jgi:hypothetical protein
MGPRLTIKLIQWSSEKQPKDKRDKPYLNQSKWHITEDGEFTRCGKNVHAAKSPVDPIPGTAEIDNGTLVIPDVFRSHFCRTCLRITGLKV